VKYTNFNGAFTNYSWLNYSFLGLGWILDNNIGFANLLGSFLSLSLHHFECILDHNLFMHLNAID